MKMVAAQLTDSSQQQVEVDELYSVLRMAEENIVLTLASH